MSDINLQDETSQGQAVAPRDTQVTQKNEEPGIQQMPLDTNVTDISQKELTPRGESGKNAQLAAKLLQGPVKHVIHVLNSPYEERAVVIMGNLALKMGPVLNERFISICHLTEMDPLPLDNKTKGCIRNGLCIDRGQYIYICIRNPDYSFKSDEDILKTFIHQVSHIIYEKGHPIGHYLLCRSLKREFRESNQDRERQAKFFHVPKLFFKKAWDFVTPNCDISEAGKLATRQRQELFLQRGGVPCYHCLRVRNFTTPSCEANCRGFTPRFIDLAEPRANVSNPATVTIPADMPVTTVGSVFGHISESISAPTPADLPAPALSSAPSPSPDTTLSEEAVPLINSVFSPFPDSATVSNVSALA